MENNGNSIFREKSIGKISSPEDLNDYVRVANPGVWLILGAIIVLLVGFVCWGSLGNIETTVNAVCVSAEGETVCYVTEDDAEKIAAGMTVTLAGGETCEVRSVGKETLDANGVLTEYARHLINLEEGEWIMPIEITMELPEGSTAAKITIEAIRPISFILG